MTKMKKYILAFGSLAMLASCKKEMLNTGPTGSADEAAIYTTTSNAANAINGIYRYLYSRYDQQNQPGQGGVMLQLDFMGEDINQSAATWYTTAASGTGGWVSHKNDASGYDLTKTK